MLSHGYRPASLVPLPQPEAVLPAWVGHAGTAAALTCDGLGP